MGLVVRALQAVVMPASAPAFGHFGIRSPRSTSLNAGFPGCSIPQPKRKLTILRRISTIVRRTPDAAGRVTVLVVDSTGDSQADALVVDRGARFDTLVPLPTAALQLHQAVYALCAAGSAMTEEDRMTVYMFRKISIASEHSGSSLYIPQLPADGKVTVNLGVTHMMTEWWKSLLQSNGVTRELYCQTAVKLIAQLLSCEPDGVMMAHAEEQFETDAPGGLLDKAAFLKATINWLKPWGLR